MSLSERMKCPCRWPGPSLRNDSRREAVWPPHARAPHVRVLPRPHERGRQGAVRARGGRGQRSHRANVAVPAVHDGGVGWWGPEGNAILFAGVPPVDFELPTKPPACPRGRSASYQNTKHKTPVSRRLVGGLALCSVCDPAAWHIQHTSSFQEGSELGALSVLVCGGEVRQDLHLRE